MVTQEKYGSSTYSLSGSPAKLSVRSVINPDSISSTLSAIDNKYHTPYRAVVCELVANGRDSHIAAGQMKPVEVSLPTEHYPFLTIEDFGTGMSLEVLNTNYVHYSFSSKRDDPNAIGFFGYGSKSAFAICDQFTVTSIHEGLKNILVATKDDEGTVYNYLMLNEPTKEPNGVKVSIPIKKDRLSHYENLRHLSAIVGWSTDEVLVMGDNTNWNDCRIPDIFEDRGSYYWSGSENHRVFGEENSEKYKSMTSSQRETHKLQGLILGGVFFNYDTYRDMIPFKYRKLPIVLKCNITDLYPNDSREGLRDTPQNVAKLEGLYEAAYKQIVKDTEMLLDEIPERSDRLRFLNNYPDAISNAIYTSHGEQHMVGMRYVAVGGTYGNLMSHSEVRQPNGAVRRELEIVYAANTKVGAKTFLSNAIISNFADEFSASEIPESEEFDDIRAALRAIEDPAMRFIAVKNDRDNVVPSAVGRVLDGTKIRSQIPKLRALRKAEMRSLNAELRKDDPKATKRIQELLKISFFYSAEDTYEGEWSSRSNLDGLRVLIAEHPEATVVFVAPGITKYRVFLANHIYVSLNGTRNDNPFAIQKALEDFTDHWFATSISYKEYIVKVESNLLLSRISEEMKLFGSFYLAMHKYAGTKTIDIGHMMNVQRMFNYKPDTSEETIDFRKVSIVEIADALPSLNEDFMREITENDTYLLWWKLEEEVGNRFQLDDFEPFTKVAKEVKAKLLAAHPAKGDKQAVLKKQGKKK